MSIACPRRRRVVSEQERARLVAMGDAFRFKHGVKHDSDELGRAQTVKVDI